MRSATGATGCRLCLGIDWDLIAIAVISIPVTLIACVRFVRRRRIVIDVIVVVVVEDDRVHVSRVRGTMLAVAVGTVLGRRAVHVAITPTFGPNIVEITYIVGSLRRGMSRSVISRR